MGRLFGTDGARGVANRELTCELALNIGRAAAMVLADANGGKAPVFMVAKDTRASGDMLEGALNAGLCSVGADVMSLGVLPTPAVAYLVKRHGASAGIMISASHNPCEYNGIKIFNGDGYKLSDELENKIEAIVLDGAEVVPTPIGGDLGRVTRMDDIANEYAAHVASTAKANLSGLRIALDCANGSASATADKIFSALGANYTIFNSEPDGANINDNCGSTHMECLTKIVKEQGFDAGFAFDGDADRCLAVDDKGNVVDGDRIMAMLAEDMLARGALAKQTLVGTVLTNMGINKFCEERNVHFVATKVGDRYILEEMLKSGYNFGGEQSGHIIFLDHCTTGDGELTAVQLCALLVKSGKKLSEMAGLVKPYPQRMVNVRVSAEGKLKLPNCEPVNAAVDKASKELAGNGRVLVRTSGTEPLIRVMTEGSDEALITRIADDLAQIIKDELGD